MKEILERSFGVEPEGWIKPVSIAKIIASWHGQKLETFTSLWEDKWKLAEKLRKEGFIIYDIKWAQADLRSFRKVNF